MDIKYNKDTSKLNEPEFKFGVWYPIESAPKDGSEIIVFGEKCYISFWDEGWLVENTNSLNVYGYLEPKYWMLLPNNPV